MVSNAPNSLPFINSHMYDLGDLRSCIKSNSTKYCHNSLSDIINKHPCLTRFKYVLKLSGLDLKLDDALANFTLFVPSDVAISCIPEGVFINMDIGTARNIINNSTLKNKITFDVLSDTPYSYLYTLNEKISISTINNITRINNCINFIQPDIIACNGVIHIVDNIIWPYNYA